MRKAMILVLLFVSATAFGAERFYSQDFAVTADSELKLENHKGNIHIRTHQNPVILVRARIYPDEGENPELVDLVQIDERSGADYVAIEVEHKNPDANLSGLIGNSRTLPLVDFEITIPEDAALSLSSHKCTFDVEAGSGEVEVEAHKEGGVIRGVRNNIELKTHKGRFTVEIATLADLSLDTHKGEVEVDIHRANDFSVRGDTHDGQLRFEGRNIEVKNDHGHERTVDYREGSGEHRIELSTHDGTITLRFVD